MSAAAYRRGSRLLSSEADKRMPAALSHADRQARKRMRSPAVWMGDGWIAVVMPIEHDPAFVVAGWDEDDDDA